VRKDREGLSGFGAGRDTDRGASIVEIRSLRLVCFSPTGTSRAVLRGVARGTGIGTEEWRDITSPEARKHPLKTSEDELLVVAVPVYMGRVPALLNDWLQAIEARKTPTVSVVVYGNRAYDDALLELRDVLTSRGCRVIAGGAFIGEHAFSSPDTPTAEGRPDASDLEAAERFGRSIEDKLRSVSSVDHLAVIDVPGNRPYGGVTELWSVDFIEVGDECTQCGVCSEACPVGAIDPGSSRLIDHERCITCCACIKACPQEARTMKAGPVRDAAVRLNERCGNRKEPALFL
jgi:ferredoxin